LVKNGSSYGYKQALCQACGNRISLKYGTAYYGLDVEATLFEIAIRLQFLLKMYVKNIC
jgi:hypothetical protein